MKIVERLREEWGEMTVMFPAENKAAIESLLFVAQDPVTVKTLSEILDLSEEDIRSLVSQLITEYERAERGIQIVEINNGFQMCTKKEYADYIEKLYRPQANYGLSKAALETLAIVAYKQPITRSEVEAIRGVKIDSSLGTLIDKNLVREVGRKEGPGRPMLFGTTPTFLKYFGLKDLSQLPKPDEFIKQGIAAEEEREKSQLELQEN